jgi:hypothetical protein
MNLLKWFTDPGPAQPGAKFQHTDIKTESAVLRDDTDHREYRQQFPRRCSGQCIADRQPMTHAGQAMAGASFVAGMIDWTRLGPREEQEDCSIANMIAQNRDAIEASEARQAQLEAGLSDGEKLIYRTYLAATVDAGQSDAQALGAMGLGRDAAGHVVKARELQPVERRRIR